MIAFSRYDAKINKNRPPLHVFLNNSFTRPTFKKLSDDFYRPRSEGDNALGSIRLPVCVFVGLCVCALTDDPYDLEP